MARSKTTYRSSKERVSLIAELLLEGALRIMKKNDNQVQQDNSKKTDLTAAANTIPESAADRVQINAR